MKACEARVVRHHLEMCRDFLEVAREKEQEALLLQREYEDLAGVKAISYEPKCFTGGADKTTRYHEIFDAQAEAELKALEYRKKAEYVRQFIEQIDDEDKSILVTAFIDGKRFWEIGEELGYSSSGVRMKIWRCLEKIPASKAAEFGLL